MFERKIALLRFTSDERKREKRVYARKIQQTAVMISIINNVAAVDKYEVHTFTYTVQQSGGADGGLQPIRRLHTVSSVHCAKQQQWQHQNDRMPNGRFIKEM